MGRASGAVRRSLIRGGQAARAVGLLTAGGRRHVGRDAVLIAVGRHGRGTAAIIKIRVPGIVVWPAAGVRGERDDLFGGGQAWVGEGRRQRRLFWRRLDGAGSGRLRLGVAIRPGGGRDGGGLFHLVDRNHPSGQEVDQNGDAARQAAIAVSPMPDSPRVDGKELREAALRDVERAERRAEFGRINWYLHEGKLIRPAPPVFVAPGHARMFRQLYRTPHGLYVGLKRASI